MAAHRRFWHRLGFDVSPRDGPFSTKHFPLPIVHQVHWQQVQRHAGMDAVLRFDVRRGFKKSHVASYFPTDLEKHSSQEECSDIHNEAQRGPD